MTIQDTISNCTKKIEQELISEHIEPFCKKYQLDFLAAMGTFVFSNHNRTILKTDIEPKKTSFHKEMQLLIDIMWEVNEVTKFMGSGYEFLGTPQY